MLTLIGIENHEETSTLADCNVPASREETLCTTL